MRAIFISYRRDDTEGYAGRLFQDLCERFGKDSVFMDVAGIEPGRDFRRVIEQQVASCGVLLALIGKGWLTAADEKGERRLNDARDFVRLETASALKRDIPVIPVLVQQATMPRADELPEDLKDLAFRNSVELSHARWDSDVELLVAALRHHVDPSMSTAPATVLPPARSGPSGHQARVIVPLAALALGGIGYVVWDRWGPGAGETKDAATAMSAASAPAGAVTLPVAPAPLPVAASGVALRAAPAATPLSTPGPGQVQGGATVAKPGTDASVASQAAPARRVDRPVLAKTPATVVAPAAPPARTKATAPATTIASLPSRSMPAASAAPAPPPTAVAAAPVPAPAESPMPDATPARRDPALDLLGGPGSPSMVTRTIFIKAETKHVNVTGGEVIRFEVGSKSFVWNFSGQRSSFDLARVAPPSVLDHTVTAYVAPNPMYPRRR
jgi:hypothetical protein